MKTIASLFIIAALLSPNSIAQDHSNNSHFTDRASFKISADFINTPASSNSFWVPADLFSTQPALGLELDYELSSHFVIGAGFTYSGSRSESNGVLDYVIRPEDDAIHTIKVTDTFRNFSFDPKAKLKFSLNNFDFFWSAGPILSFATLQSATENSTFADPNNFSTINRSSSHSFGYGGQASTGIQYLFSQKIGLSLEIGYKTVTHNSLYIQQNFGTSEESVNYSLNSIFQRVGIVFRP